MFKENSGYCEYNVEENFQNAKEKECPKDCYKTPKILGVSTGCPFMTEVGDCCCP